VFHDLLMQLLEETTQHSLRLFSPELALTAGIVLLLLARLCDFDRAVPPHWIALWSAMAAFALSWFYVSDFAQVGDQRLEYFSGLMVFDSFTAWVRLGLMLFLVFVITLTVLSGIPDQEDGPDFYSLLLGAVVGMSIMVGANNLLMVFLGIEMASVPSYALVGFLKGRRQASEAALKFVVYGAGAAGVMLYGISLLAGLTGTTKLPELAARLQVLFADGPTTLDNPAVRTLALAALMIMAGVAFKLSVVPFHFWAPDAFQGAAAEVGGFLSVASKAAAFALLVRLVLSVVTPDAPLREVYQTLGLGLGILAAITVTFGNLAAYSQRNMKRLLAYSTIAHAGYMLMAVAAVTVLQTTTEVDTVSSTLADRSARAIEGLLYYLAVYLFMNLGAFAITALIRNEIFSEEIDDYAGLGYQCPVLAVGMALCLFSLVGLPPLGGFVGKLFVFAALFDAGAIHGLMWAILVIAGVNTVFSLFYYVRVLKVMYLQARPAGARPVRMATWSTPGSYVLVVTIPLVVLGLFPNLFSHVANSAADALIRTVQSPLGRVGAAAVIPGEKQEG
jgi:NADH-quinone oxidoreductase subunit N